MNTKWKIILIVSLLLIVSAGGFFVDSCILSPTDFKVNYLDVIDNPTVPEKFNGCSLMYFTDLQYGKLFDKDKLAKLEESLEYLNADIIVFGGDLFDENYSPTEEDIEIVEQFLSNLNAKYGKFAILGDYDCANNNRIATATKVLQSSNFEIISGQKKIYVSPSQYINLVGYSYNQSIDFNVVDPFYTIVFTHNNAGYANIPSTVPLVIYGDSHLRQSSLNSGISLGKNGNSYQVASIGLTGSSYRLFNDPEILMIRFKSVDQQTSD